MDAVFSATIAGLLSIPIGFLWYSEFIFGKIWRKSLGLKPSKKDVEKNMKKMPLMLLGSTLCAIGAAFVLSILLKDFSTLPQKLLFTFIVWGGIGVTTSLPSLIYLQRPKLAFSIDMGYVLANLLASALTLHLLA